MNAFLDALRECIGWNHNHAPPFFLLFLCRRSNLEDDAASPLRLFTADRRFWARSPVFFAVRYFFASSPPYGTRKVPATVIPLLKF